MPSSIGELLKHAHRIRGREHGNRARQANLLRLGRRRCRQYDGRRGIREFLAVMLADPVLSSPTWSARTISSTTSRNRSAWLIVLPVCTSGIVSMNVSTPISIVLSP